MIKHVFICLAFSFIPFWLFSQTWFLKEQNGKFGYVDSLGSVRIPFEYSFAYTDTFSNKIAFVVAVELEKGKIIAIDKNNKKLFTVFNFDNAPDYIEDGLFRIVNDSTGYIGFADMQGNIIISPRFFHVDSFSGGFAAFNVGGEFEPDGEYTAVLGGKWGYIGNTGKEVFPAIFDKASPFENGKARVQIGEDVFLLMIEVYNKK
ncbi:MAG: WG repeat-containing protein [Candidatus Azobacteroides sp.]|nr:WG repeat-containing protein [Candidatus Azobacteroides sp.]